MVVVRLAASTHISNCFIVIFTLIIISYCNIAATKVHVFFEIPSTKHNKRDKTFFVLSPGYYLSFDVVL